ncbi:MAG: hypothetical protein KAI47_18050, partial [Deltaproteobacteria bacterium]|nr:hypothetical protein [Deltaproteobacteria bacterium]
NGAAFCERCLVALRAYREWGSPGLRFLKALLFGSIAAAAGAGLYYAIVALTGYEIGLVAIVVGLMVGAAVRAGSQRRGGPGYQALAMVLTYLAIVTTYMHMIGRELDKMSVRAQRQAIASIKKEIQTRADGASGVVVSVDLSGTGSKASLKTSVNASLKTSKDISIKLRPMPRTWIQQIFLFGLAFIWPFLAVYEGGGSGIMGLIIVGFAIYEAWKLCKRIPFDVDGMLRISGVREAEG